jgi:acyl dehydratase
MTIMKTNTMGNYFEEFSVGDIIEHSVSKTIFESDNNLFSLLTMNHHPVHTNADYASTTQHGRLLVVGTLVFSLVVGMTVSDISGKAIANLDYEKIEHLAPVFIGDTLYARSMILDCIESKSKKDRGIIYVETTAYNQLNTLVLRFKRHVLIPKRSL